MRCLECFTVNIHNRNTRAAYARAAGDFLTQLLGLECAKATCPYCGKANTFPGFTEMIAYSCQHCGRGVEPAPPLVK